MTEDKKPNIVFMLFDNLGWGDLGCYGGSAPTPRLDALANEGIRFKNYNDRPGWRIGQHSHRPPR